MNDNETEEVGRYRKLDQCCKTHRKCPLVIHSNKTRWGYTNDVSYTLYDCKCDDAFYQCLKKVIYLYYESHPQKQPSIDALRKKCSENMQPIYRRSPMPKCDLNKVAYCSLTEIALRHGCSPINLLHMFRAPFYKNTYRGLLLHPLRLLEPYWFIFDS